MVKFSSKLLTIASLTCFEIDFAPEEPRNGEKSKA